ncbi:MAG: cyclase family protein [Candidatus Melainabacteria bacterium]
MPVIDISVPISERIVTWPGDPSVKVERVLDLACGDAATVSRLDMGAHTGTHVDAFSHFLPDGKPLDQMDLAPYVGNALVVDTGDAPVITKDLLESHPQVAVMRKAERLIFRTKNSRSEWWHEPFNEHFVHLAPDAAETLARWGTQMVGIDYLSVEGYHSDALYVAQYGESAPTHRILLRAGVYIVEGLRLNDVQPGPYHVTVLPLNIHGGDGAPARAILVAL